MTEQEKYLRLMTYGDGFDVYLDDGRVPDGEDDLLSEYVRDVVDRNPWLGGDVTWRGVFKENLQGFLGDMIDRFNQMDHDDEKTRLMQARFMEGSTAERRALWTDVKEFARSRYTSTELDTDGYDRQLTETNEREVFDSFVRQWAEAERKRVSRERRGALRSAASEWEARCQGECQTDYETKLRVGSSGRKYPMLAEIAAIIGRSQRVATEERSRTITSYLPQCLSNMQPDVEIDRIMTGRDIERVVPTELSYLADPATEILFYAKYGQRQLQQFASPGREAMPQDAATHSPRTSLGPIIVSVDTSSSMDGEPGQIAHTMLHQLLDVAKKERRKCYLITFSVRSRALDLSQPGRWREIEDFLASSFSGGTNGESMLRDALRCLDAEDYRMADVLIISDFAFAPPRPETIAAIRRHQSSETRFYGLQIGSILNPYSPILNRIWII